MKFSFHTMEVTGLDGVKTEKHELHKALANAIYAHTRNLDLLSIAIDINLGKEVTLEKAEVAEVRRLLEDEKCGFYSYVKKVFIDYIKEVEEADKAEKEKAKEKEEKK